MFNMTFVSLDLISCWGHMKGKFSKHINNFFSEP